MQRKHAARVLNTTALIGLAEPDSAAAAPAVSSPKPELQPAHAEMTLFGKTPARYYANEAGDAARHTILHGSGVNLYDTVARSDVYDFTGLLL